MNLDNAILAHYEWKNKLKAAITAHAQLDSATISLDNCCEFGKWLYGDGGKQYGKKPEFIALLQKHKTFHAEAGKVASAINAKKYEEASKMIETTSPFGAASVGVGMAVNALKRVAV
jgi:methyl-accepting chemotaxis protein